MKTITLLRRLDTERRRVRRALRFADAYGTIDGDHHKTWVIDQMVRALTGRDYVQWVIAHKRGDEGPETYGWDIGIAP